MRGMVDGLVNPQPLVLHLPAVYHGEGLTPRLLAGLDDVLAPILSTIDNVDAHLDPRLTPPDFLPWLAGWVGFELNENWSESQQRSLVARMALLLRWRGTKRGMVDLIRLFLAIDPARIEIEDSGGVAWSATPNGTPPGGGPPTVTVRLRADGDGDDEDDVRDRLDRLVAAMVPAHVGHEVEVAS